eukprot:COSAG02_NODE_841_length_16613_cov_61.635703_3_plen_577_part_00
MARFLGALASRLVWVMGCWNWCGRVTAQSPLVPGHTQSKDCLAVAGDMVVENDQSVQTSVETISTTGVTGYTTYTVTLHLQSNAMNCYSIYGDSRPLRFPPAYQVPSPFGSNVGGVSPAFFALNPTAQYDSWLTVGETAGNVNNQVNSIGIDFSVWTDSTPLQSSADAGGSVFWMDPDAATQAVKPDRTMVIAQLTLQDARAGSQDVHFDAQGRSSGGPADWEENCINVMVGGPQNGQGSHSATPAEGTGSATPVANANAAGGCNPGGIPTCKNGGTCTLFTIMGVTRPNCKCASGWAGDTCMTQTQGGTSTGGNTNTASPWLGTDMPDSTECPIADFRAKLVAVDAACCVVHGSCSGPTAGGGECNLHCAAKLLPLYATCNHTMTQLLDAMDGVADGVAQIVETMRGACLTVPSTSIIDEMIRMRNEDGCTIEGNGVGEQVVVTAPNGCTDTDATLCGLVDSGVLSCEDDFCPDCTNAHKCDATCVFDCAPAGDKTGKEHRRAQIHLDSGCSPLNLEEKVAPVNDACWCAPYLCSIHPTRTHAHTPPGLSSPVRCASTHAALVSTTRPCNGARLQ